LQCSSLILQLTEIVPTDAIPFIHSSAVKLFVLLLLLLLSLSASLIGL